MPLTLHPLPEEKLKRVCNHELKNLFSSRVSIWGCFILATESSDVDGYDDKYPGDPRGTSSQTNIDLAEVNLMEGIQSTIVEVLT